MDSEKKSRIAKELFSGLMGGTISLTLSAIIVKLIGLFYKIPIAALLGDEGMGYFNTAYTVYAFFYLISSAGVPKAVMILVSEAKARGLKGEERRILRVASVLFGIVGALMTIILFIFASPLASLIGNAKSYLTMLSIAPSIVFVSLSGVIRGYLSANSRLGDIAVSQIIEGVGKLGLGLLLAMIGVRLRLPLSSLSALTVLGVSFGAIFGFVYLFICLKLQNNGQKAGQSIKFSVTKKIAFRILSISIPITVSAAIMSITNLVDLGLVMRGLVNIGYSENVANILYGNYTTLAVPMLNLAMAVISPISIAFLPIFTKCYITSDNEGKNRAERNSLELVSLLSAPITLGLIIYSKEILLLLFPNSEISIGSTLLCLIAPSILFSSILLIINTVLEGYGRVKAPLISMLVGGFVKIICGYCLIVYTDMGILGAPIGTVLSYASALITSIIIYSVCFKKHIPIFESSIIPYLNAFISVSLSRYAFLRLILPCGEKGALIIAIVLAALIYLAISALFGLFSAKKITELAKYTNLS